jgi:thioredoxin-related protein
MMLRLRLAALAALVLAAMPAGAQTDASVIPADAPNWLPFAEAVETVRADSSLLLIHLYAKWCGWCARLDNDVYTDDAVQAYLADNYTVTRVDIESDAAVSFFGREMSQSGLASAFQVSGTPTTVFVAPDGTYLTKLPGYAPADQFALILRYVREGGYNQMPFPDWVERQDGSPTVENASGG